MVILITHDKKYMNMPTLSSMQGKKNLWALSDFIRDIHIKAWRSGEHCRSLSLEDLSQGSGKTDRAWNRGGILELGRVNKGEKEANC